MIYKIESWDGYLVSLARRFGTSVIYTLDKSLNKVEGMHAIVPLSEEDFSRYQNFIRGL